MEGTATTRRQPPYPPTTKPTSQPSFSPGAMPSLPQSNCPCSHPKPAPALIQILPLHMSTGLHPFSLIQGLNPCSCVLSLICLSPLSVESFLSSSMHAALPPNFKILSHSPRSPCRYYLISQLLSIAIPPKGCWMIASLSSPPLSLPPIPVSLCPHHCTGYSSQGH